MDDGWCQTDLLTRSDTYAAAFVTARTVASKRARAVPSTIRRLASQPCHVIMGRTTDMGLEKKNDPSKAVMENKIRGKCFC